MLFPNEMQKLQEQLRQDICRLCVERKTDGTCGLSAAEECPIDRHLAQLVSISQRVESRLMREYCLKVRQEICSSCEQDSAGDCGLRDEGHCPVDAYLSLILESIDRFMAERKGVGPRA